MPPKKRARLANLMEHHDPIGRHILALRTFHRCLNDYKEKIKMKTSPGPIPSMPEYPKEYPTPSYLEELRKKNRNIKPQLVFKGHLSKEKINEISIFAIRRILLQVGYHDECMDSNNEALVHLSDVVDMFLQSFVNRLRFHKDSKGFCNSPDLWNPLETTLQDWGFNGVIGIAKYFYEEFVEMADALHNNCREELDIVNNVPPVQTESPESIMEKDLSSSTNDEPVLKCNNGMKVKESI